MNYIEEVRDILSKKINVNNNLLNLYTLLVFTKGKNVTLKDVHDAWAIDKNRTFPEHYSIIPFEKLSFEVQQKDLYYANAIKETAIQIQSKRR